MDNTFIRILCVSTVLSCTAVQAETSYSDWQKQMQMQCKNNHPSYKESVEFRQKGDSIEAKCWYGDGFNTPRDGGILGTYATSSSCYWMKSSPPYPWVSAPQGNISKTRCFNLDSCNGGRGQSGGGCYKWATSADAKPQPW